MKTAGPDYLAMIHADWDSNLNAIRHCITKAYDAVAQKTDINVDPDFASPNRPALQGYLRWGFVDTYLARACSTGLLNGITAHWIPTKDTAGAIEALELRGKYSALTAHHLQFIEDVPRESRLRLELRLMNQRNPLLPNFAALASLPEIEDEDEESLFHWATQRDQKLINITLVHGAKSAEFAYLRVYDSIKDGGSHTVVSGNIMALPVPSNLESEAIPDPEIDLRPGAKSHEKQSSE